MVKRKERYVVTVTFEDAFLEVDPKIRDTFFMGLLLLMIAWYATWHTFCFLSNPFSIFHYLSPSLYLSISLLHRVRGKVHLSFLAALKKNESLMVPGS
jgi:hypothetical protein